jgi:hypothetical protein
MKFENIPGKIKKAMGTTAKIGLTGLTMLDPSCTTGPENSPSLNKQIVPKEILENENTIERKNPSPESYDLSRMKEFNITNLKEKKSLDGEFIERSTLKYLLKERFNKKKEDLENLEKFVEILKGEGTELSENLRIKFIELEKEIKKLDEQITRKDYFEFKKELSLDEKDILEITPTLYNIVELARTNTIKLIKSKEYHKKIKNEFNCSEQEATLHQMVRVSNANNANYSFVSPEEIIRITGGCYDGFVYLNSNMIVFSYGDINSVDYLKNFYDTGMHELGHEVTSGENGMSNKAIELLSASSFINRSDYSVENNEYMAKPTERYTRLKILEKELDIMGIKKIEEKFEPKHYEELYKLYKNDQLKDKLLPGSIDFLNFTKSSLDMPNHDKKKHFKLIKKLFDEIAEIDKNKKGKTYKNFKEDYNNLA